MAGLLRHRVWFSEVRLTTIVASMMLAAVVVGAITVQPAQAQTYKVLYTFLGGTEPDGSTPVAGLVRTSSGALYGTTSLGGTRGGGTVFKLSATGQYSVLHNFRGGKDGKLVLAGLIRDNSGNLYGTTWFGGGYGGGYGAGTVFKVSKSGKEEVLHAFKGQPTDGGSPAAGLVRDSAGSLYGTTFAGGTNNFGMVFRVAPNGKEKVLYSFPGGANGFSPVAGLVRDAAGNLYGTTEGGGTTAGGIVFKLDVSGTETVLYTFTGGTDGGGPEAGLIRDTQGNLYGTTVGGGAATCRCGTVFKLDTAGTETVLHSFDGTDGSNPVAGLVRDAEGNFYGTASAGGALGFGTVFKLDTAGVLTVLYSFAGQADGAYPKAGSVLDAAGNLYGTASQGGNRRGNCRTSGCGVVFEITP